MKILWLTWKDRAHPDTGGAEIVAEELGKRLASEGHELVFLTGSYKDAKHREFIELPAPPPKRISAYEAAQGPVEEKKEKPGFWIIRVGNRVTVYWRAFRYFKKHLSDWPDIIIEEVNTIPFFSNLYTKKKRVLLFHMLCRQIWWHEIFFPASLIGYLVEPIYLRLLGKPQVITVSESSRQDLAKYGFKPTNTHIISEGIEIDPIQNLEQIEKFDDPTILSLGSIRSMKKTLEIVQAFELAKQQIPHLKLIVAGSHEGNYAKRVLGYIHTSPFRADIDVKGKVSKEEKINLMQRAHIILVSSIKEGWGLIVTEAASQGTPAVVYNVDGLRDSVRSNETGIVVDTNTPTSLSSAVVSLLKDSDLYQKLRRAAWEWSKEITFDRSYQDFKKALGI